MVLYGYAEVDISVVEITRFCSRCHFEFMISLVPGSDKFATIRNPC